MFESNLQLNVNFILGSNSFINNGEDIDHIYKRINELDLLFQNIEEINERKMKLNRPKDNVYKNLDIYEQIFYDNTSVIDFIYGTTLSVSSDHKKLLRAFIDKYTTIHNDEVIDKSISFYSRGTNICNKEDLIYFSIHEILRNIMFLTPLPGPVLYFWLYITRR